MRTFIAVPLSKECHTRLSELQSSLRTFRADVGWTAISSIHLTLKFLGEIDPGLVPRISSELRTASQGILPFRLTLRGLGGFPNLRNAGVLWCGVEGDTRELSALQKAVEQACAACGFVPEGREFHPHLTLGRVRGKTNLQPLLDYIRIAPDFEQPFVVDRYHVIRSVLTPRGANYTVLETVELVGKTAA
jgi:RNA 2',3'-cyclic 3'-phosphodiesterase